MALALGERLIRTIKRPKRMQCRGKTSLMPKAHAVSVWDSRLFSTTSGLTTVLLFADVKARSRIGVSVNHVWQAKEDELVGKASRERQG
jgi:hypothetical protein